jgi:hypothetical protein
MKGRKHNSAAKMARMGLGGAKPLPDGGNPKVTQEAQGKTIGMIDGAPGISRMRLDRPGRKRGGRVGADRGPLSSAAKEGD